MIDVPEPPSPGPGLNDARWALLPLPVDGGDDEQEDRGDEHAAERHLPGDGPLVHVGDGIPTTVARANAPYPISTDRKTASVIARRTPLGNSGIQL